MGFRLDHTQVAMPHGREDHARAFYRDIVGLEEIEKPEPLRNRGGVWFRLGDQQLHLGVDEPFAPARKAHPGIRCSHLDEVAAKLISRGFPVEWDSNLPGEKRFYTQDPFGNRYLGSNQVEGVLLWNSWGKVDAARDLIRSRQPLSPEVRASFSEPIAAATGD